MAEWMKNLPFRVTQKPITKLILPGSHNSASSSVDSSSHVTPDFSSAIRLITSQKLMREALGSWMKHQAVGIEAQLSLGIRYFDLKVAKIEDDFFIVNGLRCGKLKDALTAIYSFLVKHSKEVVLLHLHGLYGVDEGDLLSISSLLQLQFGSLLLSPDPEGPSLGDVTLEELWKNRQQMIALAERRQEGSCLWNAADSLFSAAAASECMQDVIDQCLLTISESPHHNINVFLAAVSFSFTSAVQNPLGNFEKEFGRPATRELRDFLLQDGRSNRNLLNVICADFVDEAGFIDSVIALNQ